MTEMVEAKRQRFPAPYPAYLLPRLALGVGVLSHHLGLEGKEQVTVLDPFGGMGGVHGLRDQSRGVWTIAGDIEPILAVESGVRWDATHLPIRDEGVDMVVTSPTYGNRMADKHRAREASKRNTYTHWARAWTGDEDYELHARNTGGMQWGAEYRALHFQAWKEVRRVASGFVLNMKDHVRRGQVVPVSAWHERVCGALGMRKIAKWWVPAQGLRQGENHAVRVEGEWVMVWATR